MKCQKETGDHQPDSDVKVDIKLSSHKWHDRIALPVVPQKKERRKVEVEVNVDGLVSLDSLVGGDALMKFNRELKKVANNILDPNTEAKKKRSITLKIEFSPDEARANLVTNVTCKSVLAPEAPSKTLVYIGMDASGQVYMNEMGSAQVPGQLSMMNFNGWDAGRMEPVEVIDYRE